MNCHPEATDALSCELMDDYLVDYALEAADQAADEELEKKIKRNAKLQANLVVRNKLEKKDNRIIELERINANLEAQIRAFPQTKKKRQAASAASVAVSGSKAKPVSDIKAVIKFHILISLVVIQCDLSFEDSMSNIYTCVHTLCTGTEATPRACDLIQMTHEDTTPRFNNPLELHSK